MVDILRKVKILEQLNVNGNVNNRPVDNDDEDDHENNNDLEHDRTNNHQHEQQQQVHESDIKSNTPISSPTPNVPIINHSDSNNDTDHQQQENTTALQVNTTTSPVHEDPATTIGVVPPTPTSTLPPQQQQQIKLIKSSRLKGYMTLTLAAFINYDAARTSNHIDNSNNMILSSVVSSTNEQRIYAQITSIISLIGTCICCIIHFDRITTLQNKLWYPLFKNGSKYEGCIVLFYTIWWSIATGIATSVNGIAGDGKGQYSLYYSTWACCLTSYWILERWCVAAGWSSLNSFIASWPNRSPAWICIMILSFFTMIWYLDLWQNHTKLNRPSELYIIRHFNGVGEGQWQWLMTVSVCTFCPSVFFVLVELFRETKADGSIAVKSNLEALIEGIWFGCLTIAWIATVMIATTPRGAASLIGNSYFFTWVMSIFVFEGFIWYIHDRRKATYQALREKQDEYHQRQIQVLQQAKEIQRKYEERDDPSTPMNQDSDSSLRRMQQSTRRGFSHEFPENIIQQPTISRRRL